MKILIESTPMALWHQALREVESECHIILKTDVESYLVFMLMRYLNKTDFVREIMASKFLKGIQYPVIQRSVALQNVGDQCLLITGLFPAFAEKRHVKLRYFIDLGRIAYHIISQKNNIFSLLSKQFVMLMDVLQAFRTSVDGLPIEEASDLWVQSSQRTFQILRDYGFLPKPHNK